MDADLVAAEHEIADRVGRGHGGGDIGAPTGGSRARTVAVERKEPQRAGGGVEAHRGSPYSPNAKAPLWAEGLSRGQHRLLSLRGAGRPTCGSLPEEHSLQGPRSVRRRDGGGIDGKRTSGIRDELQR